MITGGGVTARAQDRLWGARQLVIVLPALLAAYLIVTRVFPPPVGAPSGMWIPNALPLVVLYFTRRSAWWAVVATEMVAETTAGMAAGLPMPAPILLAVANSAEVVVIAAILSGLLGAGSALQTLRAVGIFAGTCFVVPALVGMAGGLASVVAVGGSWAGAWLGWWLGDCLGYVICAPLLIALVTWRVRVRGDVAHRIRVALAAVGVCATGTTGWLIFRGDGSAALLLAFVTSIVLALAFGSIGAACGAALVGLAGVFPAIADVFAEQTPQAQLLLIATVVAVLLMGAARDRTLIMLGEQRRLTARLAESNADLAEFAYIAGHDFKQPLRTIRLYTELLSDSLGPDELDGDRALFLHYIDTESERLQALTADLLDYSRATGDRTPHQERRLIDLVTEALDALGGVIEATDPHIVLEVPDTIWLTCNRAQMVSLFQNLIDNAIKYRSPGRPAMITVTAQDRSDGLHCAVVDNGIGMLPDQQRKAFDLFRRYSDTQPGSGLGLPIVARVASQHRAQITLTSDGSNGTTLSVRFPPDLCHNHAEGRNRSGSLPPPRDAAETAERLAPPSPRRPSSSRP